METNEGLIKWTMWECPMIWKAKCYVPSFILVTQSCVTLNDVFATTSMNFRKFTTWKDVFESPYIMYRFDYQILTIAMSSHTNTSMPCANFIKARRNFNMGKIHDKPKLYQCHTNSIYWPWLFSLSHNQLPFSNQHLMFSPTHSKGVSMPIHLISHFKEISNLLFPQF
jgi:hypothetical protein